MMSLLLPFQTRATNSSSDPTPRRFGVGHAFLLALILLAGPREDAHAEAAHRVLFINSYHPDFPTTVNQMEGLRSVLPRNLVALDIEFMDSKRFNDPVNLGNFYNTLVYKLAKNPPYDLLITADDNALRFALTHQEDLFQGLPIIFFGINNKTLALEQDARPSVCGVVESLSMLDTLQLMKKLHPHAKTFFALVDGTDTGQSDLETFYSHKDQIDGVEFTDISLKTLTYDEFAMALQDVPDTDCALLLSAFKDKNGQLLRFDEGLQLVRDNLHVPIYHLWYHGLGEGILGGKFLDHFDQATIAARMALEVLNGRPMEELSVITESPNRFMFDHIELERFGFLERDLPEGSSIINTPFSFYRTYPEFVWVTTTAITVLTTLVAVLLWNVIYRYRAEGELQRHHDQLEALVEERTSALKELNTQLKDSEERFRSLSDAAFEGIVISEEGVILETNHAFCMMIGRPEANVANTRVIDLVPREDRADLVEKISSGYEMAYESRCLKADGSIIPIELQSKTFSYRGKQVRVTAVRDLTERQESEEEINGLVGILPLCSYCKKIRDDKGYWEQVDLYIHKYSKANVSHGICPECMEVHVEKERQAWE